MKKLFIFITLSLATHTVFGWEYSQHIKLSSSNYDTEISYLAEDTHLANYRLNIEHTKEAISFKADYEFFTINNTLLASADAINAIDDRRLLPLTSVIYDDEQTISYHRLDRFYVSHKTDYSTTRYGRQAVSWGNGLFFNPMDIFNPFSPTALDKEYKPGDDMIYYQQAGEAGSDLQMIYLFRRDEKNQHDLHEDSYAIKFKFPPGKYEADLLLAKHYDDKVIGAGISRAIASSIWRTDMTIIETKNDRYYSLVSNIDYSWIAFNKNFYGFAEYYHNGFAEKDSFTLTNTDLITRLTRGEVFTHYRDYLALGLRIELHPLVNLAPGYMASLHNSNATTFITLTYDWKQNISIKASYTRQDNSITNFISGSTGDTTSYNLLFSYYF